MAAVVFLHRDDEEDADVRAAGGEAETLDESAVGFRVRTQEEASFGTTACEDRPPCPAFDR
jgi:hypothetical protein